MEIEISEGCYSKQLKINGKFYKNEEDSDCKFNQNILEIIKHNIDSLNEHDLCKLIEYLGEIGILYVEEQTFQEACSQCGSYGSYTKYTL